MLLPELFKDLANPGIIKGAKNTRGKAIGERSVSCKDDG